MTQRWGSITAHQAEIHLDEIERNRHMLSFKDQIIYIQHTLQQIESFLPVLHSFECENYVSSKIDTYFQVFCNVLHNFYQEWDLNPRGLLPIGT